MENEDATVPENAVPAPKTKRKRRWLKRILIAFAAIFALSVIVVAFFLGAIVEFAANNFGAKILGVDKCRIGAAKIYPFVGYARFENMEIGKPIGEGLSFGRDLLSVGLVDVDVSVVSLFSAKKVLEHFEVREVAVCYEQPVSGLSNVEVLLKNLCGEPADDVAEKQRREKNKDVAEPEKEIFIGAKYFVVENVRADAVVRGIPVMFPPISSNYPEGIGMDKELSPSEFGMRVAGEFVNVIEFFRKSVVGDAAGAIVSGVSDAASMTEDAAGAAAGAVSDAAQSAAGALSEAVTPIRNLFSSEREKENKK